MRNLVTTFSALTFLLSGFGAYANTEPMLTVTSSQSIELTENAGSAINFNVIQGATLDPALTSGVTASGFVRYVLVDDDIVGQTVLTTVTKGDKSESLPSNTYSGEFDLESERLEAGKTIPISGSETAFADILRRLNTTAESKTPNVLDLLTPVVDAAQGASSDKSDPSSQYQTPEPLEFVENEDGSRTYVTTEGCTIRPDIDQLRAFQQNKIVTVKGSELVSEGECSDSEVSFPIQRSYSVCRDKVYTEPTIMVAQSQYVLYYNDKNGNRFEVQDCTPDTEKAFPIIEKPCQSQIDLSRKQVIPQASLIYLDESNREITVRGCANSNQSESFALEEVSGNCGYRHDFSGAKSHELKTYTYMEKDIQYTVGGCLETGNVYAHKTVINDWANNLVCSPIKSSTGKILSFQSRIAISVNGSNEYITPCTPNESFVVFSTTEGCTNPAFWTHDVKASVSYGMERFYFNKNGSKQFVTECQNSETTYIHEVEVSSYSHDDASKTSMPRYDVYITLEDGNKHTVSSNALLDGTIATPYELTGQITRLNGNSYYEECSLFQETDIVQNWKRPDESIFEYITGKGDPSDPVYDCYLEQDGTDINDWKMVNLDNHGSKWDLSSGTYSLFIFRAYVTYQADKIIKRRDGATILQDTQTAVYLREFPSNKYYGSIGRTGELCNGRKANSDCLSVYEPIIQSQAVENPLLFPLSLTELNETLLAIGWN